MKPRIVIDARFVGEIPHGTARYVGRIAEGLRALRASGEELPYEPHFLVGPSTPRDALSGFDRTELSAAYLHPREWFEIPRALRKLEASAYHSPTFASLPSCPVPWIVTIHDLIHLHFNGVVHRQYYRWLLKPFAQKAAEVVTVSESSREEIASWLGMPRERIQIVRNAMDARALEPVPGERIAKVLARFGLEQGRYFLCMSNSKPHKNVATLIEAYRLYRTSVKNPWKLVLSLSLSGFESEPGVVSIRGLSADEGTAILAGGGGAAFPSLYEGFGLPPIEAVLAGVPLAVSRIPPHEEGLVDLNAGEAIWVDPRDVQDWAAALAHLASDSAPRVPLETRRKILDRYDFRKTGRDMDQIYRRVLGLKS